ncbi:signal recognition particle subunit SRP72-like [Liolophura sinensis]|uniref:signal recognition particle subunit SRP72-like n=1 Tax=Liolophura sinensis TaxID=3198878 RepID=UPI0031583DFA
MAQEVNIAGLYADLNRFGQSQEYERAVKVANKILQENAEEKLAFHCKVVCQIQLGRFDDALTAIHKQSSLSGNLQFEKAYCEYRLNRTKEALATLRAFSNPDYRCKELLAQVLYRLEQYNECFQLYKELIKNSEDDFDEERETNLAAVVASLQLWQDEDVEDPGIEEKSYELCYNSACYLIGKGDIKGAEHSLKKAEILCRKSFEDDPDATEEDVLAELGIIRVQLAYVKQLQRKEEEALQIYNQVLKQKPTDVGLVAVASNNVVTINKDQNMFDSKKKIKVATSSGLHQKLSAEQRKSIAMNQCLLHMYTNQGDQCKRLATSLQNQYPESETPLLIQVAQFVRDKQIPKAIQLLQGKSSSGTDITAKLTMAQLCLAQGSVSKACDALRSLGDLSYKPGVVSALVTLYRSQEDHQAALDVLTGALNWYRKNAPESPEFWSLMRATSNLYLKNGNAKQAAQLLEEIRKTKPKDPRILAQLITAYAQFDSKRSQEVSRDLPSVEEIASSVDVESLEASFNILGPKYMKKLQKAEGGQASPGGPSGDMLIQKKKKKKRKKGKLPKDMDSAIDPERWLPKRERSYYRGKRKDKRKDIGKGTQGASPAVDSDPSKTSSNPGSEASSPRPGAVGPSPQSAPGPRQQKPQAAQKKKKKKGGKGW